MSKIYDGLFESSIDCCAIKQKIRTVVLFYEHPSKIPEQGQLGEYLYCQDCLKCDIARCSSLLWRYIPMGEKHCRDLLGFKLDGGAG